MIKNKNKNKNKNSNLLEKKPYLTKKELALLLDKQNRELDNRIQVLLKKGELISLKRGLYVAKTYFQQHATETPYLEFIANILYYPSYLSLEYVLQKENLIPESVFSYTSVTNKITRSYENELGAFSYRSLKPELFTGFESINFNGSHKIKIASKAKALFDWLYLKTFTNPLEQEIKVDLRIHWELFDESDLAEFENYVALSKIKKMKKIYQLMEQIVS